MISKHAEEARELIDLVAEAMDGEENATNQYRIGREMIVAYYAMHPKAVFAVSQASKYLMHRVEAAA